MFAVKGDICIKLVDFTLRFFIALLIGQHFKMTKSAGGFEQLCLDLLLRRLWNDVVED